jgi:hypothetical protein
MRRAGVGRKAFERCLAQVGLAGRALFGDLRNEVIDSSMNTKRLKAPVCDA